MPTEQKWIKLGSHNSPDGIIRIRAGDTVAIQQVRSGAKPKDSGECSRIYLRSGQYIVVKGSPDEVQKIIDVVEESPLPGLEIFMRDKLPGLRIKTVEGMPEGMVLCAPSRKLGETDTDFLQRCVLAFTD